MNDDFPAPGGPAIPTLIPNFGKPLLLAEGSPLGAAPSPVAALLPSSSEAPELGASQLVLVPVQVLLVASFGG